MGTLLLAILAAVAGSNGIEVFRNYVLADNEAVLALLERLGASRDRLNDEVYEIDLPLPTGGERLADAPVGRSLRAFATGATPDAVLVSTIPPLWSRHGRRLQRQRPLPALPEDPRERGLFAHWLDVVLDDTGASDTQVSETRSDD